MLAQKRAWFSGKTTAFQAVVGSSILPARTAILHAWVIS